jgi:hypothetical protein
MRASLVVLGIIVGLGASACSSIEGLELRLSSIAPAAGREAVASIAQSAGFVVGGTTCITVQDPDAAAYCAVRPSKFESWPLTLTGDALRGEYRVFVGRRNVGLTYDEQAVIIEMAREMQRRGLDVRIQRNVGVRLPVDLRPLLRRGQA